MVFLNVSMLAGRATFCFVCSSSSSCPSCRSSHRRWLSSSCRRSPPRAAGGPRRLMRDLSMSSHCPPGDQCIMRAVPARLRGGLGSPAPGHGLPERQTSILAGPRLGRWWPHDPSRRPVDLERIPDLLLKSHEAGSLLEPASAQNGGFMTRSVMFGLAAALAIGSVAQAAQTVQKSDSVSATATIQAIDKANRLVTVRDESGAEDTMQVRPAMKRFDELKVGDKVKITYTESLVLQVRKPGDAVKAAGDDAKITKGTGASPAVTLARSRRRASTSWPSIRSSLDHSQDRRRPDGHAQGRKPQEPRRRESRGQDRHHVHAGRHPERRAGQVAPVFRVVRGYVPSSAVQKR